MYIIIHNQKAGEINHYQLELHIACIITYTCTHYVRDLDEYGCYTIWTTYRHLVQNYVTNTAQIA